MGLRRSLRRRRARFRSCRRRHGTRSRLVVKPHGRTRPAGLRVRCGCRGEVESRARESSGSPSRTALAPDPIGRRRTEVGVHRVLAVAGPVPGSDGRRGTQRCRRPLPTWSPSKHTGATSSGPRDSADLDRCIVGPEQFLSLHAITATVSRARRSARVCPSGGQLSDDCHARGPRGRFGPESI